jgi:hypothetical protein
VRDSRSDVVDPFLVPLIIKNPFLFSTTKNNSIFNSLEKEEEKKIVKMRMVEMTKKLQGKGW